MKTAVITGAGSGMGRAVAKAFLQNGYAIAILDMNESGLQKTLEECKKYPAEHIASYILDVSSESDVETFAKTVAARFDSIDALVNCAGVFRGGLLHESAVEDYTFQFDVNVKGTYLMMRSLIPLMLENGGGAIVNIASISGMRGDYNAPLYCASKAAVINLTKACALDYAGKGIRINCISPSATATPMFLNGTNDAVMSAFLNAFPDHSLGQPEQIADAVMFLVSDAAKHIIGHNLPVDGGLTCWNGQPKQDKTTE